MYWSWAWDEPPSSPADRGWVQRDPSRHAAWRTKNSSKGGKSGKSGKGNPAGTQPQPQPHLRGAASKARAQEEEEEQQQPAAAATTPHFFPSGAGSTAAAGLLRRGDRLRMNCVMNTRDGTPFSRPLPPGQAKMVTGMDKGMEMCGTLLMYYPHDPTVRYTNGAFITHLPGKAEGDGSLESGGCYEYDLDSKEGGCKRQTRSE